MEPPQPRLQGRRCSKSVTFCEKGEQGSGRMDHFRSQTKNKPEQSELCSDVAAMEWMRVRVWNSHKESHGWTNTIPIVLPMNAGSAYSKARRIRSRSLLPLVASRKKGISYFFRIESLSALRRSCSGLFSWKAKPSTSTTNLQDLSCL